MRDAQLELFHGDPCMVCCLLDMNRLSRKVDWEALPDRYVCGRGDVAYAWSAAELDAYIECVGRRICPRSTSA